MSKGYTEATKLGPLAAPVVLLCLLAGNAKTQDRLPPIPSDKQTDAQKKAAKKKAKRARQKAAKKAKS